MLTAAITFLKSKFRLMIEYGLIGLVLVTAGLCLTLWIQREQTAKALSDTQGRLVTVSTRLGAVEVVNDRQEGTIAALKTLRQQDSDSLTSLLNDYSKLTGRDAKVRAQMADLEKRNAQVRDYLDQPVPDDLKCLLENKTCPAGTQSSN